MIDFKQLNDILKHQSKSILSDIIPDGRILGNEFVASSKLGGHGDSFKFNINKGIGKDFATNESFGDIISLYADIKSLKQYEAAEELAKRFAPHLISNEYKPRMNHSKFGAPVASWCYKRSDGVPIFYVARYNDKSGEKHFLPYTFVNDKWICKLPPAPRPLYNLTELCKHRDKTVLVVEGEKAAEAAITLVGDNYVVTTWANGAESVNKSDWSSIFGRNIVIWPDSDTPGRNAAKHVSDILLKKCKSIHIIDTGDDESKVDAADFSGDAISFINSKIKLIEEPKLEKKQSTVKLEYNQFGKVTKSDKNLLSILKDDPELSGRFRNNSFSDEIDVVKYGAWCVRNKIFPRTIDNKDIHQIKKYIIDTYDVCFSKSAVTDEIITTSLMNDYDPLLNYLDSLKWDGVNRIDTWLIRHCGVKDSHYTRVISTMTLVAAVKRAYKPGCKYDHILVLEGDQSLGKSTLIEILAGEWYITLTLNDKDKDTIMKMKGAWIIELPEGMPFKKKEVSEMKNFVTEKKNKERFAYERLMETHKRRSIFIMSMNPEYEGYLQDPTGNRRFFNCTVTKFVDFKELENERNQLFAEAKHLMLEGYNIHVNREDKLFNKEWEEELSKAETLDDWGEPIIQWLQSGKYVVSDFYSNGQRYIDSQEMPSIVSCGFIWQYCLKGDPKQYKQQDHGKRISKIMIKLGFNHIEKRINGVKCKGFNVLESKSILEDKFKNSNVQFTD